MADVSEAGSTRSCGVGNCACLVQSQGGLGDTSGPRIDRIPPTRPPWWRRQYRELKKIIFLRPSTCPIDLFGPVANRRILKRLHAAFCLLVSYNTLARLSPRINYFLGAALRYYSSLYSSVDRRSSSECQRCRHASRRVDAASCRPAFLQQAASRPRRRPSSASACNGPSRRRPRRRPRARAAPR